MKRHCFRGVAGAVALTLSMAAPLAAHPLRTTITELTEDRGRGVARATIRVFADDFATAVKRVARNAALPSSGPAWDAASLRYASFAFTFADKSGRALSARSCGVRRTADLLWLCLEVDAVNGLSALTVRNTMLCDLFEDQVNVVQGTIGGARRSLLFTRGDRVKPLL